MVQDIVQFLAHNVSGVNSPNDNTKQAGKLLDIKQINRGTTNLMYQLNVTNIKIRDSKFYDKKTLERLINYQCLHVTNGYSKFQEGTNIKII